MQSSRAIRVVINTNLWISFLIGKQLSGLKQLLVEGTIQPIFCEQILDEILLVTQRPKLQKYFAADKVAELMALLKAIGIIRNLRETPSLLARGRAA